MIHATVRTSSDVQSGNSTSISSRLAVVGAAPAITCATGSARMAQVRVTVTLIVTVRQITVWKIARSAGTGPIEPSVRVSRSRLVSR